MRMMDAMLTGLEQAMLGFTYVSILVVPITIKTVYIQIMEL